MDDDFSKKAAKRLENLGKNIFDPDLYDPYIVEQHRKTEQLLSNIKKLLPELIPYTEDGHFNEDRVYRYYHHSAKVFHLQEQTLEIVELLKKIAPDGCSIEHSFFLKIIEEGTGQKFDRGLDSSEVWEPARRIVEANFHARYMISMAVKYGQELEKAPMLLPSGWAALLYLYLLR